MQLMVNYIEGTSCSGKQEAGTPSATAGGCTGLQASSRQPQVLLGKKNSKKPLWQRGQGLSGPEG